MDGTGKRAAKPRAPNAGEIKQHICDAISEGVPLREICREPGMPAWRTVYVWMGADAEFDAAIARARGLGADAIAEESLSIVDAKPERTMTGAVDPGSVAHAKLRAEHRLKLLAKWHPKKYGDKLEIDQTTTVLNMSDDEIERRSRAIAAKIAEAGEPEGAA